MSDTLHPELNAEEFDVEAFLQDAKLPEESARVYKRADVIAELSELKRRIELESRVKDPERGSAEEALSPLEQEYLGLLKTFADSALTVYVRALTAEELREQRKVTEERVKDLAPQEQNLEFGYDLLSLAIIAVKTADGERKPVKFTSARVKALRNAIGDNQVKLILDARQNAQNAVPTVDADFLPRRSGEAPGSE